MKKSILSIVACFLLVSTAISQNWVSFTKTTPEAPIVNLTGSNNQSVSFTVEVCGMYKQNITEGNVTYQRVSIPSSGKQSETGKPELPFIRQLIAIPECSDVTLSVNIIAQTSFSNYNIYPAPGFQEAQDQYGGKYLEEVFTKDAATYAQNLYLPGTNAEINSTGYLRGQKYAEVYIYPVQFNPVSGQLNVYTNYQLTLSFTNSTTAINTNTGIFNNVAANAMLNYVSSGITASVNDNMQGNGNVQWISITDTAQACNIVADYLIICSEDFYQPSVQESEVLRIANHRATYNGFDVAIINAKTIYDVLDFEYSNPDYEHEQKIRTCIRRIYEGANAQHTYDGKLGYVLFVGDTQFPTNQGMPTSYNHNYEVPESPGKYYPADYYFSCVTKQQNIYDETGDLFIGRFCVDNDLQGGGLTELHNVVEKTIYYESEATFGGWRDETGVLVHEDFTTYMPYFFDFVEDLVPSYFTMDEIDASQPNTHNNIYQVINDGTMLFTYYGHGLQNGWSAGGYLDMSYLMNNITNTYKAPVVHAVACETGWFDKAGDCIGEGLVTYSESEGFTGYLGAGRSVYWDPSPYGGGSVINYPPDRFQELLLFTIMYDLSHINGEYVLESKILYGSGQYKYAFNFFGDPALNVMAQGFQVTQDVTLPAFTVISNEITVKEGATLTIPANGLLHFEADGKLIIEQGSTLVISDDAVLNALNANELEINGDITIGDNVTFSSSGALWDLYLNNTALQTVFDNATFEKCRLHNYGQSLTISNSTFDDCNMAISHRGEITVNGTTEFNNTWLYLENTFDSNDKATVTNCSFTSNGTLVAIDLWNYDNYDISNNTIDGYYNGIQISQSGYGQPRNQIIQDNTISNCTQKGILAYGTIGDVYRNHIFDNNYGVWFGNQSDMRLKGYSAATANDQTQEIYDNDSYEVYASQYSFPSYFRYNVIIDEDNFGGSTDPLVYYSSGIGGIPMNDVRYNC
jgi:hypothetical protein